MDERVVAMWDKCRLAPISPKKDVVSFVVLASERLSSLAAGLITDLSSVWSSHFLGVHASNRSAGLKRSSSRNLSAATNSPSRTSGAVRNVSDNGTSSPQISSSSTSDKSDSQWNEMESVSSVRNLSVAGYMAALGAFVASRSPPLLKELVVYVVWPARGASRADLVELLGAMDELMVSSAGNWVIQVVPEEVVTNPAKRTTSHLRALCLSVFSLLRRHEVPWQTAHEETLQQEGLRLYIHEPAMLRSHAVCVGRPCGAGFVERSVHVAYCVAKAHNRVSVIVADATGEVWYPEVRTLAVVLAHC